MEDKRGALVRLQTWAIFSMVALLLVNFFWDFSLVVKAVLVSIYIALLLFLIGAGRASARDGRRTR